jgi:hypothetical protein
VAGTEVTATILLPAYNEEDALPSVLADLAGVIQEGWEILVVDDGSSDRTAEIASAHKGCRLVRHGTNLGKGAAMQTGFAYARGERVVVMDADATYPASAVPRILALLEENDLVRCVRERGKDDMPAVNRLGNKVFDRLLSAAHGLEGVDQLSGLYGIRRDVYLRLNIESQGFDVEAELWVKAHANKLTATSFPIAYQTRLGDKKLRPVRDGFRILSRMIVLLIIYNPLRVFVLPGVVILSLSLGGAIALSGGTVQTPYFGLAVNSFIVVALGTLAGLQLVIFGIAAALFGVEVGYHPPGWLVALSSRRVRLSFATGGAVVALGAGIEAAVLIGGWLLRGTGAFDQTRSVVLSCTLFVFGLEVFAAALFLSIFAGRLQHMRNLERLNVIDLGEVDPAAPEELGATPAGR